MFCNKCCESGSNWVELDSIQGCLRREAKHRGRPGTPGDPQHHSLLPAACSSAYRQTRQQLQAVANLSRALQTEAPPAWELAQARRAEDWGPEQRSTHFTVITKLQLSQLFWSDHEDLVYKTKDSFLRPWKVLNTNIFPHNYKPEHHGCAGAAIKIQSLSSCCILVGTPELWSSKADLSDRLSLSH